MFLYEGMDFKKPFQTDYDDFGRQLPPKTDHNGNFESVCDRMEYMYEYEQQNHKEPKLNLGKKIRFVVSNLIFLISFFFLLFKLC